MKIALIRPYYPRPEDNYEMYLPFGIAYVASYIRQFGHDPEIIDMMALRPKREEVRKLIRSIKCDIVGISSLTTRYVYVKELISIIKEELGVKVILGGPLASDSPELVLRHTEADICVIGQGEHTCADVLANLDHLESVLGIVYKTDDGHIVRTPPRPPVSLDELPWPAYDLLDMKHYIYKGMKPDMDIMKEYTDLQVGQMVTVQGCPLSCNFCSRGVGGYLRRSVPLVEEEAKYLKKTYGVEGINFADDLLILSKKRAHDLATMFKPLRLRWAGQARVDHVDYELLKYMKSSGLTCLGFGVETVSPRLLIEMNKRQTVEQEERAIRWCLDLGIDMKIQLIFGYPGETMETIQETIDFFARVGMPGRRFNMITPLPGSTLYQQCLAKELIVDEDDYLTKLSQTGVNAGFSRGLPILNLTQFPDEKLLGLKEWAERKMRENYQQYLKDNPKKRLQHWYRRLTNKSNYQHYLSHPTELTRRIVEKVGIIEDKAEDRLQQANMRYQEEQLDYEL